MAISAYGGKPIGFSPSVEDIENEAQWAMRGGGKGGTTSKISDAFDLLKDAYTFAKNNKDYLDNPGIQEILTEKLHTLQKSKIFTPVYKPKGPAGTMGQGGLPPLPGQGDAAVAGPGAGQEGSLELDPLATVYAMYDRFMQEHPNVYKPETVDTVQGGVPGTQRIDPLAPAGSQQKSQFFAKPYQTVGPDQEIVQWTEMGPQRVYKGEQTFAPPTPKTQYGTIELDSKTGRWGQYSDAGKFEPIMTSEELAAKAKSGADQDIPNSVYNNNFNNALKDAYEKANPDQKAWIGKRIYNWFFGSDPEAFEDLIKPYLEKYNNYYRQEQGKNAPKSTPAPQPSAVKRKPLSAHFGASAPSSTQSKVFKPES